MEETDEAIANEHEEAKRGAGAHDDEGDQPLRQALISESGLQSQERSALYLELRMQTAWSATCMGLQKPKMPKIRTTRDQHCASSLRSGYRHTLTPQSAPEKPGEHSHAPVTHMPCPEHMLRSSHLSRGRTVSDRHILQQLAGATGTNWPILVILQPDDCPV